MDLSASSVEEKASVTSAKDPATGSLPDSVVVVMRVFLGGERTSSSSSAAEADTAQVSAAALLAATFSARFRSRISCSHCICSCKRTCSSCSSIVALLLLLRPRRLRTLFSFSFLFPGDNGVPPSLLGERSIVGLSLDSLSSSSSSAGRCELMSRLTPSTSVLLFVL